MTKKLRVGLIGLGGIARLHLGGWAASPLAEVVMGSDVNPDLAEKAENELGVPHFTSDPMEIIDNPEIDVVDICSPNRYHARQAIAALEAGKHVMCEKPLAPTVDEIRQMIAARDRSGKLLMTAQHFRFTGTARALKAEIDGGALGPIYHARAWWLRRSGLPVRPTFIYKEQAHAGVGLDIGVHVIDLALWLMGSPRPVAVSGVARTELARQKGAFSRWGGDIPTGMDVDEFSTAFVRFENGASMVIEVSWLLHHGQEEDLQAWLYGTRAGAHWPSSVIFEANNQRKQHYDRSLKNTEDTLRPHHLECVEFAEAIASGGPSPVPPEQSLQVGLILEALYRSQETGKEVRIDGG